MDHEAIVTLISDYEIQIKALKRDLFRLMWYMRGSISYEQIFNTTYKDRIVMSDIIKENMEASKDLMMPLI